MQTAFRVENEGCPPLLRNLLAIAPPIAFLLLKIFFLCFAETALPEVGVLHRQQ